jgi:hypothetical protein
MLMMGAFVMLDMLGVGGCSTPSSSVMLEPVGPQLALSTSSVAPGELKAYTATDEYSDGWLIYHPHSRYAIFNNDGTLYKWVSNHVGMNNDHPELVDLPPGRYLVWANSETQGLVKVPVIIQSGKTTVVNLERKPVAELDKPRIQIAYPET